MVAATGSAATLGFLGALGPTRSARATLTVNQDRPYWRFWNKCFAMFFNGYPNKGRCAAGNSHVAQGYQFVLPHSR